MARANSWRLSSDLRQRVLASVDKTQAPIMLIHAANDYDTAAGTEVAAELERLHQSHVLKIYPPLGKSSEEGHNLLYLGISEWELEVFQFLGANVKR